MNRSLLRHWLLTIALLPLPGVLAIAENPDGPVTEDAAQQGPVQQGSTSPQSNSAPAAPLVQVPPVLIPLTVGEKFKYAVGRGFGPGAALRAFAVGGYQQYFDYNSGYGQGAEGYFSRVGARYGKSVTKHLLGSFALASIFRQDPRYIRSSLPSKKARLGYALSRVMVTRGDHGRSQFNISGVGGTVGAAFISNTWHEPPDNTSARALKRSGTALALEGLRNVVREFWPEIRRLLRR